ncbi:hypothetical protein [uncultured Ruegeria sp.]|uniref:hypothetical protein n=1 Tax=uncultured Ruegeria sp. TaxID=259304 RepID=UPI00262D27D3|nr:hypothetical protein [uncultured Ruegeria sp.]
MFDTPSAGNGLHYFLSSNSVALQNAVLLLGGPSWVRRFLRIICDLEHAGYATPKIHRLTDGLEDAMIGQGIAISACPETIGTYEIREVWQ